MKLSFIPVIILAVFSSLLAKNNHPQSGDVVHHYVVKVWNVSGNMMSDVKIHYTLKENSKICIDSTVALEEGNLIVNWNPKPDPKYPSSTIRFTSLEYEVTKDGYYPARNYATCTAGIDDYDNFKVSTVNLLCANDYLKTSFINSVPNKNLKKKLPAVIQYLRAIAASSSSELETRSIDKVNFKNRSYLSITFSSTNSYNSLKLSKYDIAKRLFDEIVRGALDPLNEHLKKIADISGYDIEVIGATKDFSDKYAIDKSIHYSFYMPKDKVESYKNKDISGQQLIDQSIVLMDDERIELKFQ